ncbi:hypothetical protein MLD38_023940 [Melastoma candidum]|uniref:Uncharacterized protein n=1 Tax=Melastoma candidum TaxID=119954 RepID=A0ACB9NSG5_9MYRT|nr:hypothetical protein MLD38_023940 [Melastoma candidum]
MMELSERFASRADLADYDNHSQLLDQFERASLEARLNRAILLGRSLSHSSVTQPPPTRDSEPRSGSRSSGIRWAVKKLLSPIFGRKSSARAVGADSPNPVPGRPSYSDSSMPIPARRSYSQAFSRSMWA